MTELQEPAKSPHNRLHFSFIVSLCLFIGLYFGLLQPEVNLSYYKQTVCTVISNVIMSEYNCKYYCDSCSSVVNKENCGDLKSYYESVDPQTCGINGTCISGNVVCNGGYYCCSTVCQTCITYRTTNGKTSCTNYTCNCQCIIRVNNRECFLNCDTLYTVNITLSIPDEHYYLVYTKNIGKEFNDTEKYTNKFLVGTQHICYYGSSNIIFNKDIYTAKTLIIVSIFGIFPLFVCSVVYFWLFLKFVYKVCKKKIEEPVNEEHVENSQIMKI